MELPSLGTQCKISTCKQLDFLPFKCNFCKETFCQDHWKVSAHSCPNPPLDARAPICPVCNKAVPVNKGEDPNRRVYDHIAAGCPTPETSTTGIAYSNRCTYPGCKQKELIPIVCKGCNQKFCISHRLDTDHNCKASGSRSSNGSNASSKNNSVRSSPANQKKQVPPQTQSSRSNIVSSQVQRPFNTNSNPVRPVQALDVGLTEEEQLQLALQMSLDEQGASGTPQQQRRTTILEIA
ncbi:zinc finger, AN1-type domain [Nowakowskiella sp. JEL0407]|nr:zinc finger, AN1-type domain [Nowakowskiella sp. JEL0407]